MAQASGAVPVGVSPPRWLLPTVLVLHGLMALVYTQIIPVDCGPDEPHHLLYIAHFEKYHDLPRLTSPLTARDDRDLSIAIHPPLYYAACWPLYHVVRQLPREQIQLVFRLVALLLAWGTLLLSYRLFLRICPDEPHIVALALIWLAFLPEFQLLSSVQNNDGAMMLLSTWLALALVERLDANGSPRQWAGLGLLLGAVVMTKATGAAFLPVPLLVLARQARRHGWTAGAVATRVCAFLAGPLVLDAWWFVRNRVLVGHFHPIYRWTGHPLIFDTFADFLVGGHRSWACLRRFLIGAQQSQLCQVDWYLTQHRQAVVVAYGLTFAIYVLVTVLELLALGGLVALVRREWRRPTLRGSQQFALGLCAALFVVLYAALAHFALFVHPGGFQGGRYLLPGVAAFALLFANGLLRPLPPRARTWVVAGLAVVLLVWNLGCMANIVGYLNPRYSHGLGIEVYLGWP